MTRDEILTMVPGPEMNEAVGKAIGATPEIRWYAMNREETGYSMDFELENEANKWHDNMVRRVPDGRYTSTGGHIVRREIYPRYSEDMSTAWTVYLKAMEGHFSQRKRFHMELQFLTSHDGHMIAWPDVLMVLRHKMPESICKASLLSQVSLLAQEVPDYAT